MKSHLGKAQRLEPLLPCWLHLLLYQSPSNIICHHVGNTGLPCWTQTVKWSEPVLTHPGPCAQDQGKSQPGSSGQLPLSGHTVQSMLGRIRGSGKGRRSPCSDSPLLPSEGGPRMGEDRTSGHLPRWHDGYHHMVLLLSRFTRVSLMVSIFLNQSIFSANVKDILGEIEWLMEVRNLMKLKWKQFYAEKKSSWNFDWIALNL